MPKDRDQLTPVEPEDRDKVPAEATRAVDDEIAPEAAEDGAPLGRASGHGGPTARNEVGGDTKDRYR
ncbi:hypothetical protein K6U06_06185 [Acidiferrimicrobium sp. IK]|uniref:hypothetical protein n=1 Tax=Acidiferrimicrobium sp. IK TaxID=2871700 RepID=UPI0021CB19F5|nr:hypothetical protein [Acidiferrimicrobium sp. IK]MCU4183941.1 hypothetical protein [Acidiferrimicrobium sp. IK]